MSKKNHRKTNLVNKIILQVSMDTGACYGVEKMCIDCLKITKDLKDKKWEHWKKKWKH